MTPLQGLASRVARVLTLGLSDRPRGRLLLRRAASRLARVALRARSRRFSRDGLGCVLVIAPHPDDEAIGCGGTVALLTADRVPLHVAFLTDGSASHPSHPRVGPSEMAARRAAEARSAAEILGVDWKRVTFLGLRDGTLARLDDGASNAAVDSIAGLIARVRPYAILLPCRRDGSSEHDAAFDLVGRALRQAAAGPRVLEFPVWAWWSPTRLVGPILASRRIWRVDTREVQGLKAGAVASYASQTLPIPPETAAALPPGFVPMFIGPEEFLFED